MMMKPFIISLLFICFGLSSLSQNSQKDFSFPKIENLNSQTKIDLWATQYYIHSFNSGGTIPMVNINGDSLGLFADTCDFCSAALEGTAYVTDENGKIIVVNYGGTGEKEFVNCRKCIEYKNSKLNVESWGKTCWIISSGYGIGVKDYKLIPFRTIAVDKSKISYGSIIYIPSVRGQIIELPNGTKVEHDGYFFAGDTGGAIKKNHIDIFTGVFTGNPFKDVIKSTSDFLFEAYIINDENIINELLKIHSH